jgi:hypothetical protein
VSWGIKPGKNYSSNETVIPAKAGIHGAVSAILGLTSRSFQAWTPAFAGVTTKDVASYWFSADCHDG